MTITFRNSGSKNGRIARTLYTVGIRDVRRKGMNDLKRLRMRKKNQRNKRLTCSGLSPGGTHVYSSRAHPESSSEWVCAPPPLLLSCVGEVCLSKCCAILCTICSLSAMLDTPEAPSCSSRGHLQLRHTFLQRKETR